VDNISYWHDILLALSMSLAIFGTVAFLYSWIQEKREARKLERLSRNYHPGESEMTEVPSIRPSYHPVRVEDVLRNSYSL
jgi:hypothetical protein